MGYVVSKVLLLEDDQGLRFTFASALQQAGHQVIDVGTVAEAVRSLRTNRPDVLILDLIIDGTYSIQVADYAGYALPEAEVIFITGSGMFPQGELFRLSGNARWVLRKPVNLQDLTDMVNHSSKGEPIEIALEKPDTDVNCAKEQQPSRVTH